MNDQQLEKARYEAQELAFEAMTADVEDAVELCREALEIYPDCVDARIMLGLFTTETEQERIQAIRAAVEAGRRDLGEEYMREFRGHFYLEVDSRPFMRAMEFLAAALYEQKTSESLSEAISIYEEMLELNPMDSQGVRDPLLNAYLFCKRYADAEKLLERYHEEQTAVFLWAKALLAHANGDQAAADERLNAAREANRHVAKYLAGKKRRPHNPPNYYSRGEDSEAVTCLTILNDAINVHPKTKKWLKEACSKSR